MSILCVENLYAGYGKNDIVKDLSMSVNEGQMVGIIGQNGCGKSTFIKAVCKGVLSRGNILIDNKALEKLSEKELSKLCSYVPQKSGLSIDISVMDVVLMGFHPYLGLFGSPDKAMRGKALDILKYIGLDNKAHDNYMELSEGQKRLCILARSLVADTKLLLLDEPDSFLDFGVRNTLLKLVADRSRTNKTGVLLALHDINLALEYCDLIYLMKDGSLVDSIIPKKDKLGEMEQKLSCIYGGIKLIEYSKENGEKKNIMVQT